MIDFLRAKQNHITAYIITIGAGVITMLIQKTFNIYFCLGLGVLVVLFIAYIILTILEIKEIRRK